MISKRVLNDYYFFDKNQVKKWETLFSDQSLKVIVYQTNFVNPFDGLKNKKISTSIPKF